MTECDEIRELIPWYANGSLSVDEGRKVAAHLTGCSACQDDLVATVRLSVELNAAFRAGPELSEAVRGRVVERTYGKSVATLDVGSFLLGFSLGASVRRGAMPIHGDLRLLGRRVRLFNTERGGQRE
jgi:anti-sigma factor RsiW